VTWIFVAGYLAVYFVWVAGRPKVAAAFGLPPLVRTLSAELHPFIPGMVVVGFVALQDQPFAARACTAVVTAYQLVLWLIDPGDDDRWKRRRRKIAAQLRSLTSAAGAARS